ncbi:hypothetical protein CR513_25707, partial [Mucuna pruriens]
MATSIHQDKILVHCFQDSLIGAALNWYVSLERGHIKTWRDLAEAFLKQWSELSAQVQPTLIEKEMMTIFIDTLPSPLYDKAVESVASSFADLVTVGERIESGIKRRKFAQTSSSVSFAKKPSQEKKKGEANTVLLESVTPYGQGKGSSPFPTQIFLDKPRAPIVRIDPQPPL